MAAAAATCATATWRGPLRNLPPLASHPTPLPASGERERAGAVTSGTRAGRSWPSRGDGRARGRGSPLSGHAFSRRVALAAGLGLTALRAWAEEPPPKLSQSEAQYQNTPKGMFRCANCTFFIKPRSCKVVTGDVSPNGWCKLFDLPD